MSVEANIETCMKCRNADGTVSYSWYHYCSNPKNTREFTIIRHFDTFSGENFHPKAPVWCPHNKNKR